MLFLVVACLLVFLRFAFLSVVKVRKCTAALAIAQRVCSFMYCRLVSVCWLLLSDCYILYSDSCDVYVQTDDYNNDNAISIDWSMISRCDIYPCDYSNDLTRRSLSVVASTHS